MPQEGPLCGAAGGPTEGNMRRRYVRGGRPLFRRGGRSRRVVGWSTCAGASDLGIAGMARPGSYWQRTGGSVRSVRSNIAVRLFGQARVHRFDDWLDHWNEMNLHLS